MSQVFPCFATCPKGLEDLLSKEISDSGAEITGNSISVVYFGADIAQLYRLCLWTRVANRVFLRLLSTDQSPPIENDLALYSSISGIPWEDYLDPEKTIAVDFIGTNKAINNTQFGAVRVKDAVVDRLRDKLGRRPDVAKIDPDIRIQVRLAKGKVQVGLDMAGQSLHQRGYRQLQGAAPIKENLAAAILMRLDWANLSQQGFKLVDPMCGSGTFLIEAALIHLNCAPGLWRSRFGFHAWLGHNEALWQEIRSEAQVSFDRRRGKIESPCILGFDQSPKMVDHAKVNCAEIDLLSLIDVQVGDVANFQLPESWRDARGLVLCNPPYGERLGEVEALRSTYFELANAVKRICPNWVFGVFTGNSELAREMRMRPKKINKFHNGALPCELFVYDVLPESEAKLRKDFNTVTLDQLSEGALMVFNRMVKNQRKLQDWIKQQGIEAYRVYDADMPEYSAAVDVYGGQIHVQEYAAPKSISVDSSQRRLRELLMATAAVFGCSPTAISVKTRQKNSGKQQYEKLGDNGKFFDVAEGQARYRVNLWDYLDTGVFLDHRPLRLRLYQEAGGKRFLNLFCYTATATVQAALGGASASVSVDMSRTYLDWAAQNLALNRIKGERHKLVHGDCLKWLDQCREGFDLIMLDPPTFSNSKRMEGVLDVQRDHVALIARCMELLSPSGTLYFSNNSRGFKLDETLVPRYQVIDITAATIDRDFQRNPKIHRCFAIKHSQGT